MSTQPQDDPDVGCGISKWWLTPSSDPFYECCAWHDGAYTSGSAQQQNLSRWQVDHQFLMMMLGKAKSAEETMRAYAYYEIARALGGSFWEGKQ